MNTGESARRRGAFLGRGEALMGSISRCIDRLRNGPLHSPVRDDGLAAEGRRRGFY